MADMRDDMTTAEAEAWADGWRAAIKKSDAMCAMVARYPDPADGHMLAISYRSAANACRSHIRALAPPAPPARTRLGILGEG